MTKRDPWNKCDKCGKFIPYKDITDGKAKRQLLEPDSELSAEKYVTLCKVHNE